MILLNSEVDALIAKIEDFTRNLYTTDADVSECVKRFSEDQLSILKDMGFDYDAKLGDLVAMSTEINDIKHKLSELPVVAITVAFEPSVGLLEQLKGFVSENLAKDAVLFVKTDSSIYGGIIVESDGVYSDYSIRAKVREIFSEKGKL